MSKINKKIMIAEDERDLLSLLKDSFQEEGFIVFTASDGQEGVTIANKEKPDLILADILMPKLDGIEMIKQIRKSGGKVPVIFLTNFGDPEHISKAIEVGNSDYIVKSDMKIEEIIFRAKSKLEIK
jgi:DNA-binding response OmpR family regulator